MKLSSPISSLLLALLVSYSRGDYTPPRYTIDLDLPPQQRWTQVAKDYSHYFPVLRQEIERYVPKVLVNAVTEVTKHLDKYFPYPYADELKGMAAATGGNATLGELVLGNVIYDMTAFHKIFEDRKGQRGACTSIVASDSKGRIYHGRNLDYSLFHSLFTNMTIIVQFKKGANSNYITGTTFAGFIGLLTGCRTNGVSISLNERDKGHLWENAASAIKDGGHGLVSLLIRDVLEQNDINFKMAVEKISSTPLITPSYIIIAGTGASDGVVITRERESAIDHSYINIDAGAWYVLETNYDHWEAPPKSDNRRDPGIKSMNTVGQAGINATSLFKVLSTDPVLNSDTVYTTIMSPALPDIYSTVVRSKAKTNL
uniref:N-acylethanolamine-hydrolyzing acid amidase n=1 Tax=Amphimedon queenslandica TaxID=400682 RepID=A0A1X7U5P5_AMPQE